MKDGNIVSDTAPKLYKATREDGTDFKTGAVDYAAALLSSEPIAHPTSKKMVLNQPHTYLSTSVEPAETLIGGRWPCRLFEVEAIGDVMGGLEASEHKRAVLSLRVVRELPAWMALGPNGEEVAAVIERARTLTFEQAKKMGAAWDAVRGAAWDAARGAAWDAARGAAWDAAWDAARGAVRGAAWNAAWDAARGAAWDAARGAALSTMVKDRITQEQYDLLMGPWRAGLAEEAVAK